MNLSRTLEFRKAENGGRPRWWKGCMVEIDRAGGETARAFVAMKHSPLNGYDDGDGWDTRDEKRTFTFSPTAPMPSTSCAPFCPASATPSTGGRASLPFVRSTASSTQRSKGVFRPWPDSFILLSYRYNKIVCGRCKSCIVSGKKKGFGFLSAKVFFFLLCRFSLPRRLLFFCIMGEVVRFDPQDHVVVIVSLRLKQRTCTIPWTSCACCPLDYIQVVSPPPPPRWCTWPRSRASIGPRPLEHI